MDSVMMSRATYRQIGTNNMFSSPRRTIVVGRATRVLAAFAAAVLMLPGLLAAQQPQVITFDDAVRIALDHNVQLKRTANSVRLQEVELRNLKTALLPSLNMSTGTSRFWGLNFDQVTGELVNYSSSRVGLSGGTSMTLFNGFVEFAALAQGRLGVEASDFNHERQRQAVVFLTMSQFLDLIQQREEITIQQENLASQQQLLTQIEEFVRVGSRPMADLYQQQAQTASAELALLDAERNVRLAETRLIQTLYLDPYGTYNFVSPDFSEMPLVPETYDVDALLSNAFERRMDLRAQEAVIGSAEQGIRIARATRYPSLSVSGSAGTNFSSTQRQLGIGGRGEIVPFGEQFRNNRTQNLGLNVSIPLFNKFRSRANKQRAQIILNNAKLDLNNLQHDIALDVRQAYLDYLRDEKSIDVSAIQLQAAEQALEAEQERYNVGASTLVELSQARAAYIRALSTHSNARFNFLFRKRLIEYHVGVLDPGRPLFE